MSGIFMGMDQHVESGEEDKQVDMTDKFETDVKDVFADGIKKNGIESHPVFNVSHDEFYSNLAANRRRQRYKSGSPIQQYLKKTKNGSRPIFVSYTDGQGKTYQRKVK